jgi:hypothetical protein
MSQFATSGICILPIPFKGALFQGVVVSTPRTSVPKSTQVCLQARLLQVYFQVHLFAVNLIDLDINYIDNENDGLSLT